MKTSPKIILAPNKHYKNFNKITYNLSIHTKKYKIKILPIKQSEEKYLNKDINMISKYSLVKDNLPKVNKIKAQMYHMFQLCRDTV